MRLLSKNEIVGLRTIFTKLAVCLGNETKVPKDSKIIQTGFREIRRLEDGRIIEVAVRFLEQNEIPFGRAADDIEPLCSLNRGNR